MVSKLFTFFHPHFFFFPFFILSFHHVSSFPSIDSSVHSLSPIQSPSASISSSASIFSSQNYNQENLSKCMDCLCKIVSNCQQPEECTENVREPGAGERCGMFRISRPDYQDNTFENKKTFRSCSKNRECVTRLLKAKPSRCPSSDPCQDHASDVFLGRNSDCSETSDQFDQFLQCYNPGSIKVSTTTTTTTGKVDTTTQSSETVTETSEPISTTTDSTPSVYHGKTSVYILYYGLVGAFAAIVFVLVPGIVCCFRRRAIKKNEDSKVSKENKSQSVSNQAINREYFARYESRSGTMKTEATDCPPSTIDESHEDSGSTNRSSGIGDCSPIESPSIWMVSDGIKMDPIESPTTAPPHVFFRHHLSQIEPLKMASGVGHFGSVGSAIYTNEFGIVQKVAIKSLIRYNFQKVMEEAQIACLMDHPHVLKLLGILIENETLKLVFPFMEKADLGNYLRTEKENVSPIQLRSFCLEIASGMEYLASKKVVHRDLAVRNCMLDSNLHIKVADFGLSRKINPENGINHHKMGTTSCIPQSSAPECFVTGGKIDSKTDVWAFGVTLWEIFNHGTTPPIMVQNDGTMITLCPQKNCPKAIYELMLKCWHYDQNCRPSFSDIYKYLSNLDIVDYVYIPQAKHRIVSINPIDTYVKNDQCPMEMSIFKCSDPKTLDNVYDFAPSPMERIAVEESVGRGTILDTRGYVVNDLEEELNFDTFDTFEYSDPDDFDTLKLEHKYVQSVYL